MQFKDPNNRPVVEPPDLDGIPSYARRFAHWVLWKFDWNEDSWAKVLYDAHTMKRAASDDPKTWGTFDEVAQIYRNQSRDFDGIGFVFSVDSDDLCGIDFDNCVDGGAIEPERDAWVEKFNSYTELSVSGSGLHVIVRGVWGKGRRRKNPDLEVYDRLRYFTFSGRVWGAEKKIRWCQSELEVFKSEMFPDPIVVDSRPAPIDVGKSTEELLRSAFTSANGDSIFRLYQGHVGDYGDDDSAADLALCSKLAFWTGGNPTILDQMFRGSRLYREKWDKRHSSDGRTYGQMTIDKALASCTTYYSGNGLKSGTNPSVEQPQETPTRGIYRVSDLREKVLQLYQTGRKSGEHPGWEGLASLYTIKKKQFTVFTGIPGSGKTAVLDNLLVNLSIGSGWRHAVCSVENQPLEDHLSTLLEIYAGEPFSPGPTPRMTKDMVERGLDWFEKHFFFVLPDESERTLNGIISLVNELDVDGVVIDPWNELEHRRPPQMTETEYVSQSLSKMRHHARLHDQHWWLVAHPTKLQKDKSTGKYLVPTLYDIAGSAHFRNKADFGLVVWRDAEDPQSPSTVFVQKVRFRWCGQLGQCDLYFDRVTGRYSETPNVFPMRSAADWVGERYEESA